MQISLTISNHTIFADLKGSLKLYQQWLTRVRPYIAQGNTTKVDLFLDVKMVSGWISLNAKDDLLFEYNNGTLDSIQIKKTTMRGNIRREPDKYVGSFEVNKDHSDTVDFLFRTCLSFLCEEKGDILLHSSAVIKDGEAWLFIGKSGVGKTTIALELNGGALPMSVDRTVISLDKSGDFYAYSTPFSDREFSVKEAKRAKIAGLVFIEQASKHEILPISTWEATTLLLRQTIAESKDPAVVSRTLNQTSRLAEQVFSCKMKFAKNDKFWNLLMKEATS